MYVVYVSVRAVFKQNVPLCTVFGASRKRKGLRLLADDRSSPTGVSEDRIETRGEKRHKVT